MKRSEIELAVYTRENARKVVDSVSRSDWVSEADSNLSQFEKLKTTDLPRFENPYLWKKVQSFQRKLGQEKRFWPAGSLPECRALTSAEPNLGAF
jgi:hypothetical protein